MYQNMNTMQQQDQSQIDIQLQNHQDFPTDTVSCIQWIPSGQPVFAIGTWDGKLKILEINQQNQLIQKFQFLLEEPILCIAWKQDFCSLYVGLADNTIKQVDMNGNQSMIGKHEGPVTGIYFLENQMIMTCSLDKTIKVWQPQNMNYLCNVSFDHKILTMEHLQGITVLGLSEDKIAIFDLNMLQQLNNQKWTLYIDSPLQSQIQTIALQRSTQNQNVFIAAFGSIDGRANMSHLQKVQNQNTYTLQHKMTFKCHKMEDQLKNQEMFPVSSVQLNIRNENWVSTAGGDGKIHFWDTIQKNRIKEFNFQLMPISTTRISPCGNYLAYAIGYDWSEGVWGMERKVQPKILVHVIKNQELKCA